MPVLGVIESLIDIIILGLAIPVLWIADAVGIGLYGREEPYWFAKPVMYVVGVPVWAVFFAQHLTSRVHAFFHKLMVRR